MVQMQETIKLEDHQFNALAKLVKAELGLNLKPEKRLLVESRLLKRLKATQTTNFSDYIASLQEDDSELRALANVLTTNVTSFFREPHHFEILKDEVKNKLEEYLRRDGTIRIWSAGCSNGSEPYSIAMSCQEVAATQFQNVRILATDIDENVLQVARKAEYPTNEISELATSLQEEFFTPLGAKVVANETLRKAIQFNRLNLMKAWPFRKQFHAIFCRNVAIYFDNVTQARLWARFHDNLVDGGLLFIGHSERLDTENAKKFSTIGITAFRKQGPTHALS